MTYQQTTSSPLTEIVSHIHDMVMRLEVPSEHLFRQLFWTEKRLQQIERSRLLQKRASLKDQGYAAAVRVLIHRKDVSQIITAQRQSYLTRKKSGDK